MTQMTPRKTKWILAAIVFIGALSVAGYFYFRQTSGLQLVHPRRGPVVEAVYGLGTVIAPQTYQVKTGVVQSIIEIYVKEGDQVQKGAALVKFDDSGVARAPFAGTVTSVPSRVGELIFSSGSALTLVNLQDLVLEVSLEQQSVLRVQPQQKALISFESLRGDRLDSKVQSIYPRETQFIVRIPLSEIPTGILPGMTADVAIEIGRKENVLSVPLRAISSGRVTRRRDGKKQKVDIQVGVVDGEWAEVTSGDISEQDEVLVRSN